LSDLLKDLPKLTNDGDIGAALLGVAIGFFGDSILVAHFPLLGILPGAASVYSGAAVLGAKRSIQAIMKTASPAKPNDSNLAKPESEAKQSIPDRARNLGRLMRDEERVGGYSPPRDFVLARQRLELDLQLFEEHVISTEELGTSVSATLEVFRSFRLGAGHSQRRNALSDPTQGL